MAESDFSPAHAPSKPFIFKHPRGLFSQIPILSFFQFPIIKRSCLFIHEGILFQYFKDKKFTLKPRDPL